MRTEIAVDQSFHEAEGYHQKWYLRRHPQIFDELLAHYASEQQMLASAAAARLNGYLGGAGSAAKLEREIERLGLTAAGQSYVRKSVGRWG